jgi:hypothetical protein
MTVVGSPYISSGGLKKDPNDTAIMMNRANAAKDADSENRTRGLRNMAAYMNDMVPGYLKNAIRRDGRVEQNFNILMPIIRGHVGNVLMNWFDPKFSGRDGDPLDAIEAITKVYLQQKELYNYKQSAATCYENGYLYRGVEQLVLDRPSSNPREWGLKFVSMPPHRVVFDPNSDGDNISRDSQEAWIYHYMTPEKVIRLFGMPGNSVERDILWRLRKDSVENPAYDAPKVLLYDCIDQKKYGSNMLVVEWMHIEWEKKTVQFLKNGTPLPNSGFEVGTMEDVIFKKQWADQRGISLSEGAILTMTDDVPTMYTTPFAPDYGILLENKRDFRQLNGRVPLYAWSFLQKNGVSLGVADYEWDIIQDFNKREMAKTKIITQSAISGKPWIRVDMFDGDSAAFEKAVSEFTDPSKVLEIPEGAPPVPAGFGILPGAQVPPSILQDENFKLLLSERVGMLPPALQGRSERSADSGVSIGRKVVEANVMMKQETTSVVQHENNKHEDWLILAVRLFGDPVNMNRKFSSADGKTEVITNEPVGVDAVGNTIMRNHIGSLKRPNVTISQAKENDFVRQVRLETAVGSLQSMPPSETNTLHRAAIEYDVVTNMDYSTDEDRERAKRLADKQLEIVELGADVQIKNLKMQLNPPPQQQSAMGAASGKVPQQMPAPVSAQPQPAPQEAMVPV